MKPTRNKRPGGRRYCLTDNITGNEFEVAERDPGSGFTPSGEKRGDVRDSWAFFPPRTGIVLASAVSLRPHAVACSGSFGASRDPIPMERSFP